MKHLGKSEMLLTKRDLTVELLLCSVAYYVRRRLEKFAANLPVCTLNCNNHFLFKNCIYLDFVCTNSYSFKDQQLTISF